MHGTYRFHKTARKNADEAAANLAAGFSETPNGHTWHHHEEIGRMQLVLSDVHSVFSHKGGFALNK
ncbi:MAG: HNH endonuclease [Fuerstiella sp.]